MVQPSVHTWAAHQSRLSGAVLRTRSWAPAFQFGLGCPSVGPRHCSFFLWLSPLVDVLCSPQVHVEKLRPTGVAGTCPRGRAKAGPPAARLSRLSQQVCPTLSGDREPKSFLLHTLSICPVPVPPVTQRVLVFLMGWPRGAVEARCRGPRHASFIPA